MATNPRFPEPPEHDRDVPRDVHPKIRQTATPQSWFPIIIILAAAAILAALIWWLPQSPTRNAPPSSSQVPVQPTGNQIQLTNLNMSPATTGGALTITGTVVNNANYPVNGIQVQATFQGANNRNLGTVTVPMYQVAPNGATQAFSENPLPAGGTRNFALKFDRVPAGWDQSLPQIQVTQVTGTRTK